MDITLCSSSKVFAQHLYVPAALNAGFDLKPVALAAYAHVKIGQLKLVKAGILVAVRYFPLHNLLDKLQQVYLAAAKAAFKPPVPVIIGRLKVKGKRLGLLRALRRRIVGRRLVERQGTSQGKGFASLLYVGACEYLFKVDGKIAYAELDQVVKLSVYAEGTAAWRGIYVQPAKLVLGGRMGVGISRTPILRNASTHLTGQL